MQERAFISLGLQSKGQAGAGMGPFLLGRTSQRALPSTPSSPSVSLEKPLLILCSTNTCLFENINSGSSLMV